MFEIDKDILKKINLASFWAFFAFGLAFVIAEILKKNSISANEITIVEQALDLPFVFIALIYALSTVKISFTGGAKKFADAIIALGLIVFLVVLYISLFVPDIA